MYIIALKKARSNSQCDKGRAFSVIVDSRLPLLQTGIYIMTDVSLNKENMNDTRVTIVETLEKFSNLEKITL